MSPPCGKACGIRWDLFYYSGDKENHVSPTRQRGKTSLARRANWRIFLAGVLCLMPDFRDVDPLELRVPPSRRQGADPAKLARQISLFGRSAVGMPPPWVYEGTDGVLVLYNGVTRATRIAKLAPATLMRVEVIGKLPKSFGGEPKIGDLLP